MKKLILAVAAAGMAMTITGAGCAKLNDSQQQDVTNILGGVSNAGSGRSGLLREPDAAGTPSLSFIDLIHHQIDGALWMAKFRMENGEFPGLGDRSADAITLDSCASGTTTLGEASCTTSCPSSSSMKIACTAAGSTSSTCNGTTYSFGNENVSVTLDVAGVTASGASYSGSMSLTLGFSADITGGSLDGKPLSCTIALGFDIAKVKAGTPQTPTLDCGNFSCNYDSKQVDCQKLQSSLTPGMACS